MIVQCEQVMVKFLQIFTFASVLEAFESVSHRLARKSDNEAYIRDIEAI